MKLLTRQQLQNRVKKDGTLDLRYVGTLGDIVYETYEKELQYLRRKQRNFVAYLPSPADIEEAKAEIKAENYEREINESIDERLQDVATHNLSVRIYKLDLTGQGGRHGKIT